MMDRYDVSAIIGIFMVILAASMLWGSPGFWAVFGIVGLLITLGAVGQMWD